MMQDERKGKCLKGKDCECVHYPHLRGLCPDWNLDEQPPGELEEWSIANWKTIPEDDRRRLMGHLREVMAHSPKVLAVWRRQRAEGMAIGSHEVRFHFQAGMQVRNVLRDVLKDNDLPGIHVVIDGQDMITRNWDDYYYGALHELAGETLEAEAQEA